MLLLVGLGNPGRQYQGNRHNVGWMALDAIHRRHGFGPWRNRFSAEIAEGTIDGAKAILMKPQTYMNESGRAAGEAVRFYRIEPAEIVAVHDELDLPPGKVRVKSGGGGAGHNGIRSLTGHLGAEYRRLRIGIGHPGHRDLVASYVLHDFAKADNEWLDPLLDAIAANAGLLAAGKDADFANRLHLATAPADPKKTKPERDAPAGPPPAPLAEPPRTSTPPADKAAGPFAGLRRLFGGDKD